MPLSGILVKEQRDSRQPAFQRIPGLGSERPQSPININIKKASSPRKKAIPAFGILRSPVR
jgi:hypothetical protein